MLVIVMNMVTIKWKNYCKSEEEKLRKARITLRGKTQQQDFFFCLWNLQVTAAKANDTRLIKQIYHFKFGQSPAISPVSGPILISIAVD